MQTANQSRKHDAPLVAESESIVRELARLSNLPVNSICGVTAIIDRVYGETVELVSEI